MTSNENDLTARIRRRTETEDREMNELAARELQTFGETLRERVRHKLRTVETVMETEIARFVVTCLTVENSPESQEFVKNAPRAALSGPRARVPGGGRLEGVPGPRARLLGPSSSQD